MNFICGKSPRQHLDPERLDVASSVPPKSQSEDQMDQQTFKKQKILMVFRKVTKE